MTYMKATHNPPVMLAIFAIPDRSQTGIFVPTRFGRKLAKLAGRTWFSFEVLQNSFCFLVGFEGQSRCGWLRMGAGEGTRKRAVEGPARTATRTATRVVFT